MMQRLGLAALVALAIGLSCNGGRLDAFTAQGESSPSGGASGGSGPPTGGRPGPGGQPSDGGEGGANGVPDTLVIDDFEDGNLRALLRNGRWYVSNDGTGVQNLAVAAPFVERPGSSFSIHTFGLGFEGFGAVLGLDVAGDSSSFDASDYAALTFSARAEAGSTPDVLFAFIVGSQHFAIPLRFGPEWEVHTIPFADALPVEDGPLQSFDPRAIAVIQFIVSDASFDFWLDDLAFVK